MPCRRHDMVPARTFRFADHLRGAATTFRAESARIARRRARAATASRTSRRGSSATHRACVRALGIGILLAHFLEHPAAVEPASRARLIRAQFFRLPRGHERRERAPRLISPPKQRGTPMTLAAASTPSAPHAPAMFDIRTRPYPQPHPALRPRSRPTRSASSTTRLDPATAQAYAVRTRCARR